jgi:hypothetical protein
VRRHDQRNRHSLQSLTPKPDRNAVADTQPWRLAVKTTTDEVINFYRGTRSDTPQGAWYVHPLLLP